MNAAEAYAIRRQQMAADYHAEAVDLLDCYYPKDAASAQIDSAYHAAEAMKVLFALVRGS